MVLDTLPQAVTHGSNVLFRASPLNEGEDGRGDNKQTSQAGPCLGAHTHRASMPQPKQLQARPARMPQGVGSTGPTSRTRSTKCPGLQRSQLRELPRHTARTRFPQHIQPRASGHAGGEARGAAYIGKRLELGRSMEGKGYSCILLERGKSAKSDHSGGAAESGNEHLSSGKMFG